VVTGFRTTGGLGHAVAVIAQSGEYPGAVIVLGLVRPLCERVFGATVVTRWPLTAGSRKSDRAILSR
jgi:hypothetical protein